MSSVALLGEPHSFDVSRSAWGSVGNASPLIVDGGEDPRDGGGKEGGGPRKRSSSPFNAALGVCYFLFGTGLAPTAGSPARRDCGRAARAPPTNQLCASARVQRNMLRVTMARGRLFDGMS